MTRAGVHPALRRPTEFQNAYDGLMSPSARLTGFTLRHIARGRRTCEVGEVANQVRLVRITKIERQFRPHWRLLMVNELYHFLKSKYTCQAAGIDANPM